MVESKKKDFYGELEIEREATPAEIKVAYKKLALVSFLFVLTISLILYRNGIQTSK